MFGVVCHSALRIGTQGVLPESSVQGLVKPTTTKPLLQTSRARVEKCCSNTLMYVYWCDIVFFSCFQHWFLCLGSLQFLFEKSSIWARSNHPAGSLSRALSVSIPFVVPLISQLRIPRCNWSLFIYPPFPWKGAQLATSHTPHPLTPHPHPGTVCRYFFDYKQTPTESVRANVLSFTFSSPHLTWVASISPGIRKQVPETTQQKEDMWMELTPSWKPDNPEANPPG